MISASADPIPDVVALAATINNDGIVNIAGDNGSGVFAVASVNVGIGGTITATRDTGGASLLAEVTICETDIATGICLDGIIPPVTTSVTTEIVADATPTFGIFVRGLGNVPFDPANRRIFLRFTDQGGEVRGATSVAVRTQ